MTKAKYIMVLLFVSLLLLIIPNISNAAVTVKRTVESSVAMKFSLSGLTLNEDHQYEYGFSATKAGDVKKWYQVTDLSSATATIPLRLSDNDMKSVFDATDTGYVTIRDVTDSNKTVVEPTALDFKIPYLQVTNFTVLTNGYQFKGGGEDEVSVPSRSRNSCKMYYQYQKITDTNIINKYKEIKSKNGSVLDMQSMLSSKAPNSRMECMEVV